ncbi:MAG: SAM-dependent methyltransferase, partial [Solirubrobacterales bacterium]
MSGREPAGHLALDRALATGLVPDRVVRTAAKRAARQRIGQETEGGVTGIEERLDRMVERMSSGPVAEQVESANRQHYEVPTEFFRLFLGPRMKYSACWWPHGVTDLAEAEE